MSQLSILKGLSFSLPSTKTDGNIYITTDTNKIYIDNGNTRFQVNAQYADYATILKNARTLNVNLSSTKEASFDGSENATLGVSGTLSIDNGGTGEKTKEDATHALISYETDNGDFNEKMTIRHSWTNLTSCQNTPYDNDINKKNSSHGFLEVICPHKNGEPLQRWTNYVDGDTWIRNAQNGWRDWVNYLDSNNFSKYALPLSGGTLTGPLLVPQIWLDHITFDGDAYITSPNSTVIFEVGTSTPLCVGERGITPGSTNAIDLGGSTLRWNTIYGKVANFSNSIYLQHPTLNKGTAPSTQTGMNIFFNDKNGLDTSDSIGRIYGYTSPNNFNEMRIYSYEPTADSTNANYLYVQWNSNGEKKAGVSSGTIFYGSVQNDYAEFRSQKENIGPGYCITSNRDGKVSKTTEKLQYCEGIVSDTYGFAIGETEECKTPIATSGRVLAYYNNDINDYEIGDAVCAGPNGKICKMNREEIKEYPDRIVGTVSEIPSYETWGDNQVLTKNRIWIKIK